MLRVLALMILLGCMDAFSVMLVFRFADFEGILSGRPVVLREIGWRSEGYDLPAVFSGKPVRSGVTRVHTRTRRMLPCCLVERKTAQSGCTVSRTFAVLPAVLFF